MSTFKFPTVCIHDSANDEVIEREMSQEEYAQLLDAENLAKSALEEVTA